MKKKATSEKKQKQLIQTTRAKKGLIIEEGSLIRKQSIETFASIVVSLLVNQANNVDV